ncbi:protein of unknown function [Chitinophaga ginsengisegetis]|uniref:DUF4270 domain-containing protein n=1 Tax=Chitinophaga ginsengisegetis TaxID=393003 RepID=A0A1T5NZX6_9BACT|nr:DUF4270 family protein [Chitinophaga ginsengisegetis]MDR6566985.1 hypothetical protein [Chitinophaga ginsengisegetis]MDR6646715.1 hypothetical protein [Chitinophaga ginsengisegetis]MDR6653065.1 hypothetical protein [Chitinophaga ginsengisegetis]SKD06020.1 protein of unknown function [Chitinophaga ginsengisegetis]
MNNTMYHLFFRRSAGGIRRYLPALLLVAAVSSCQKTGFTYNNVVDNNQNTDYILTDTLTVNVKTVQQDSVPTSGAEVLLAGKRVDPLFGTATIQSYFQIAQPAAVEIPVNGSAYDSMVLIMRPNGYIAGDSTIPQDLQVYRVTSTIQTAKNFYYLYNNSSFSTESTPIGSFSGIIRPGTDKTVTLHMSDQLGAQLFGMLRDKSPDITANNTFLEFFKGLNVRGGPNSKAVSGFSATDSSLVMRLYYHVNEIITTVKYVDFKMQASNLQFNQVVADHTGTPLAPLTGNVKELSSASTGNRVFTQPITGSATRIDIPYIKNLVYMGQFFKIMKVYMTLKPVLGTYTDSRLPPRMALCEVNKLNDVTDTLTYGQLTVDKLYDKNTNYTFDITSYVTKEQTVSDVNSRGLLLTPSATDSRTTLDRLVTGDQKNTQNQLKIQLYYLLYK